ncbi:MAG: isoprenylcysteine carboxylmethyltransferase family protein [bacterium]
MKDFLRDKTKYIKEPWRLRVHLAYVLVIIFSLTALPRSPFFEIGTVAIFLGVIVRAWASGIVKKDESLAAEGPYSLCRNPLYVGNFLIGYGFCLLNGHWWSYLVITVYFVSIYPFTVRKETRKLQDLFGEEFEQYRQEVPLFLPRLTPYKTLSGWSIHQYFVDNKDYLNEGAVLLFWCYCLYVWL